MGFDVLVLFLEDLFCDTADEAHALLIFLYLLSLLPQLRKSINEDTTDNIPEKQLHKDRVDHIEEEAASLERLHLRSDLLLDVQLDNAVQDRTAMLFWQLGCVEGLDVEVYGEYREDADECCA